MKTIKYGKTCNIKDGDVVCIYVYGTPIIAVVRLCADTRCKDCCLYQIWNEGGTGKCARFSRLDRRWNIPVFSFVPAEDEVE